MRNIRSVVLCTAMITGATMFLGWSPGCDLRHPGMCRPVAAAARGEGHVARRPARAGRVASRHGVRHHTAVAARRATLRSRSVAEVSNSPEGPPQPEVQPSAATRRFREIISPRSLVASTMGELRSVRLVPSVFNADPIYPPGAGTRILTEETEAQAPTSNRADAGAGEVLEIGSSVRPTAASVASTASGDDVQDAERAGQQTTPARTTDLKSGAAGLPWLEVGFLACGALLMVGSVFRLLIG